MKQMNMKQMNKKIYKFCLVMAGVCFLSSAQIVAQTQTSIQVNKNQAYQNKTLEELVKEIFINNPVAAATVKDVKLVGAYGTLQGSSTINNPKKEIAYFFSANSTTLFPITEGLLLGTGNVTWAEHSNDESYSQYFNGPTAEMSTKDPDLKTLSSDVHDYVYLQFDFIPNATSMQFKYAFASEEYPTYVNSQFNDVFGFFVSDVTNLPTITYPTNSKEHGNIALLPDGASKTNGDFVGINTVNSGYWDDFNYNSQDNSPNRSRTATNKNLFIECKKGSKMTQYNGYTKEMTASVQNLIPCHTYRLKLAVANVANDGLGSAVFLKAGSFVLDNHAELHLFINNEETTGIFKGCDNSVIRFTRPDSESTNAQTYNLDYSGLANDGTYYTDKNGNSLPSTITFSAGQKVIDMPIKATDVAVAGSQFAVSIYATTPDCTSTEASSILTLTINDRTTNANVGVDVLQPCNASANGKITVTTSGVPSANMEYSINQGANWQTSNVFDNLAAGTYEVAARRHLECDSVVQTVVLNTLASDAGPDIEQSNPVFTMAGSPTTGTWTVVGATPGVQIADPSKYNTTVTLDLNQTKTATLQWTVTNGSCSESDIVELKYKPAKVYLPVNPGSFFYKK
jgi:hypothetical protein